MAARREVAAPARPSTEIVPLRLPADDRATISPPADESRRSDVDEWGRSERVRAVVRRLYDPVYANWFRADWDGLEKIPTDGGALLIANHAGAIPSDAPVIMHGIEKELGRPVYGMADYFFRTLPVVGTLWSRAGGVPAHPDNAYRLLREQQQLVLVFPEGTKATAKSYTDRYQLRRFGRGGFVEIAMRAGVPVVPIAVVGAEEAMPIVFRLPAVAKALRLPYFPVTANLLLLGPSASPCPSRRRSRCASSTRSPSTSRPTRSGTRRAASWTRPRPSGPGCRRPSTTCCATRRSVWFG